MGAAVGTQASTEVPTGKQMIHKSRRLLQTNPALSNHALLKQLGELPTGIVVNSSVLEKVRQHANDNLSDSQVLAEVSEVVSRSQQPQTTEGRGGVAAGADSSEPGTTTDLSKKLRGAEFSTEQSLLGEESQSSAAVGCTTDQATTVSMMSPEFKRAHASKNVPYPPLKESAQRLLPRHIAGSFSCHGQSDVGKYKENQDRGAVCYPFNCSQSGEQRALFVVADGHGERGHDVADFVVKTLISQLSSLPITDDEDVDFADIRACFVRTNEKLGLPQEFNHDASTSGTTCVVSILRPNHVILANVGDSRAVVGRTAGPAPPNAKTPVLYRAIDLTVDHKPDSAAEKERIERAGGFVTQPEWSASSRVWLDATCTWPGLAMARSLGDHCVKEVGVTAEPDVKKYVFEPNDAFIIMATDGIWEFLSSEDVVQIISINLHSPKFKEKSNLAEICAMEVIKCAIRQWKVHEDGYRDDITCSVILLPWLPRKS